MADKIQLEVVTPERRVLSETVDSVILPGSKGYLGVLPNHAPVLTGLQTGEIAYEASGRKVAMAVCGGYAEILGDRVRVLADTCELSTEIDVDRAQRAKADAESKLARLEDLQERDLRLAEFRLKKAVNRIAVHGGR